MQSLETKIIKFEKFVAELETMNAKLLQDQSQISLSEINELFETLDSVTDSVSDSDSDADLDTDSDISFTEEEREHIENEEHYAFLKRYSLKPTVEMPFVPN
jgi:hypothetical protein